MTLFMLWRRLREAGIVLAALGGLFFAAVFLLVAYRSIS